MEKHLREKNALIAHYGGEPIPVDILNDLAEVADEIRPYLGDSCIVRHSGKGNESCLRALRHLLDVLRNLPVCDPSHTVAGAVCTTMGIGPGTIQRVVAVTGLHDTGRNGAFNGTP